MHWDFVLILFIVLVLSGIIWVWDRVALLPKRRQRAREAMAAIPEAPGVNPAAIEQQRREAYTQTLNTMPWWVSTGVSLFPVILFVFILRSFLFEPFRIPSGSMMPTLKQGDFILVNKYEYGVRLPIINKKIIDIGQPARGDVLVFRYPVDPAMDYIKRVVGLPGDKVDYIDKTLYINGKEVPTQYVGEYYEPDRGSYTREYTESLAKLKNQILVDKSQRQTYHPIQSFPDMDQCHYSLAGVSCEVPAGHYFVMGDNRDNSLDSRYWGFVPDQNIVGRAFFIWMNFGEMSRIGRFH